MRRATSSAQPCSEQQIPHLRYRVQCGLGEGHAFVRAGEVRGRWFRVRGGKSSCAVGCGSGVTSYETSERNPVAVNKGYGPYGAKHWASLPTP
eukprot:4802192-Prymnesium_polylepis.1